jgi:hypothetical protein
VAASPALPITWHLTYPCPAALAGCQQGWPAPGALVRRRFPVARGHGQGAGRCRRGARVKSGCDNHLEGSSIKRYSKVAQAMNNLIG